MTHFQTEMNFIYFFSIYPLPPHQGSQYSLLNAVTIPPQQCSSIPQSHQRQQGRASERWHRQTDDRQTPQRGWGGGGGSPHPKNKTRWAGGHWFKLHPDWQGSCVGLSKASTIGGNFIIC